MIKIGIMGASGYAGEELIRILLNHLNVQLTVLSAKIDKIPIYELYPWIKRRLDLECADFSPEEISTKCDVVFLALPHMVSMQFAPLFLNTGKKVIDLSADFRIKDVQLYEKWYEVKHTCPEILNKAIYGLPEFYRKEIKKADIVANPGCYPTAIILGCAPLLKEKLCATDFIISDSKSGVSGAGRTPTESLMFTELQNSFRPYKVNSHRHIPEIDQELSKLNNSPLNINFIPHLVPMERGLLSTIYLKLKKNITTKEVIKLYKDFYNQEYFVRVLDEGELPDTKDIVRTNFCDIGLKVSVEQKLVIVMSAIDNLVKGASGQAVQNMNIMLGFEEKESLWNL